MSYPIRLLDGEDPGFSEKLRKARVRTTTRLLERAKDPKGRKALAAETGIAERTLLRCANKADLMRVKGIAEEYSELLEAVGVDTLRDLRMRNAANLHRAIVAANLSRNLVRTVPSQKHVERWVEAAKGLSPVIRY